MSATIDLLTQAKRATARRIVDQMKGAPPEWAAAPMVNPAAAYTDPDRHRRERQVLFRETPQVGCLSRDLAEPGAFRTIDETGLPIVLVRGEDGSVAGFVNRCPHRGARLVREASGKRLRFSCWFHGWTFAASGRLIGVPERAGFEGCLDSRDLTMIPVEERHGIVFYLADPHGTLDLDRHLDGFGAVLDRLGLDRAELFKETVLSVAANWKYALDTYGEGYHFAALHRNTLGPHFRADIQVYDRFGRHHRVNWAAKPMEAWQDQPEAAWDTDALIGWVHYLYPNAILFVGSVRPGLSYLTLFRLFPEAEVGRTRTLKSGYALDPIGSAERRAELEAGFDATVHVVTEEDYRVAAEGWAALAADPEHASVVYGRQEMALQNMHLALAEAVGAMPPVAVEPVRGAAE